MTEPRINSDPDLESVLRQMKEDYVSNRITLDVFEQYVYNRLRGHTPMKENGFPVYYEYNMLNNTILNQLA